MLQRSPIKRTLPVKLTDLEFEQRSLQLAETVDEITRLETEKSAEARRMGELIAAEKEEQKKLSKAVETRTEHRKIVCEWTADIQAKEWRLYRSDTGEVIQQETMAPEDLQISLHAVS